LEDFNTVYGPQRWRELLQREVPGLTAEDVEWLSAIKEEVRPKRRVKQKCVRDDSGKRKRDGGAHRDPPGKQRRGESGTLIDVRTDLSRAATVSELETTKPMETDEIDDNHATEGEGKGTEGHKDDIG
jgi:hypothetical protein